MWRNILPGKRNLGIQEMPSQSISRKVFSIQTQTNAECATFPHPLLFRGKPKHGYKGGKITHSSQKPL